MNKLFVFPFQFFIEAYSVLIPIILYVVGVIPFLHLVYIFLMYCLYCQITAYTKLTYSKDSKEIIEIINKSELGRYKFKPHFFLPSTMLQTILMPFIGYPKTIRIRRENVNKHGTHIDWVTSEVQLNVEKKRFANKRLLIILPGITGGSDEPYIANTSQEALKHGYDVVIYQNRLLSTSLSFDFEGYFSLIEDFRETVDYIENNYPEYDLYALGNSNGANTLCRFLGKYNSISDKIRIKAAVSLANPFDMSKIEKRFRGTLYDTLLTHVLHQKMDVVNHPDFKMPEEFGIDLEAARNCHSVRDFDELLLKKIHGFDDLESYYQTLSSVPFIKHIKVPILFINSVDDQIAHEVAFPYQEINENENAIFMLTKYGGHLCWIDNSSLVSLRQWPFEPAFQFLDNVN